MRSILCVRVSNDLLLQERDRGQEYAPVRDNQLRVGFRAA